jgi:outer membrane lipoprotein SlyB
MAIVTKTFAAATCSWIDQATGLPEVDVVPITAAQVASSFLTGNQGFRFSNYMEVWVRGDFTTTQSISARGFSPSSGIYRGPSYGNIPSHAFDKIQEVFDERGAVRFTQVVGARTVSPEVIGTGGGIVGGAVVGGVVGSFVPVVGTAIGALIGGVVGGVAGEIGSHQLVGFPPIWSKIQIRIFKDGRQEAQMLQHSLFPSLTYYRQLITPSGAPSPMFERLNPPEGGNYYNATKAVQLPLWQQHGWGPLEPTSAPGPRGGNPWGIRKGVTGGGENVPVGT